MINGKLKLTTVAKGLPLRYFFFCYNRSMKKFFLFILILFGLLFVIRFVIGGSEDGWICVEGNWVKHGNPSAPMPESGCGETPVIDGNKINTKVGETFSIKLDSNPTTGYSWQAEYDDSFLELVDQGYVLPDESGDLVGAGGTEIFEFRALEEGQTTVTMIYKRSWEEEALEERVYKIVIVK